MTNNQTELIPPSIAEKLDAHARLITTFIHGEHKGEEEMVGYAFLVGRQLLQAKADLPHGNSGDANAGLKHFVEARFPDYTYRTASNRMVFAEIVMAHLQIDAPKSPLLLGRKKLSVKSRSSIVSAVRSVMDGKGMMEFMRSGRLLLDPAKPKVTPRKATSKQEAAKAKIEQARRVFTSLRSSLDTAKKTIAHLPLDDCQQSLDSTVTLGNALRERIKHLKGGTAASQ